MTGTEMELEMRLETEGKYEFVRTTKNFYCILLVIVRTHMWKIKSRENKEGTNTRHAIKMSKV